MYAVIDDVLARYEGANLSRDWVETLIEDAEQVLRDEIPGFDERVETGRIASSSVIRVVSNLVLSVVRNPAGVTQQSAGEFSYSFGAGNAGVSGRMVLSAADRRALVGPKRASTMPLHDPQVHRPFVSDPWRGWEQRCDSGS